MIELKEYGLYLGILTVRGIYLEDPELLLRRLREEFSGLNVQALNVKNLAGFKHILVSVLTALEAINHKLNIAKNLSMEVLVRASVQRQITEAINILGVKKDICDVTFIVIGEKCEKVEDALNALIRRYDGHIDEHLLEEDRSSQIMEIYGISEEEVKAENEYSKGRWEAIKNLIAEKVALTLTL
jgi:KEOPS complex subunit Cgi121